MVIVSGVVNFAYGAIGLEERVAATDGITIATLMLGFVITGMGVSH